MAMTGTKDQNQARDQRPGTGTGAREQGPGPATQDHGLGARAGELKVKAVQSTDSKPKGRMFQSTVKHSKYASASSIPGALGSRSKRCDKPIQRRCGFNIHQGRGSEQGGF